MWEHFDDSTCRSVASAVNEAERLGHRSINCFHLLLGIISVDSMVADYLEKMGLDLYNTRLLVEDAFPIEEGSEPESKTFTTSAKRTIARSFEEAKRLGHNSICPAHILLAVLREREDGDRNAARILPNSLDPLNIRLLLKAKSMTPYLRTAFLDDSRLDELRFQVEELRTEMTELRTQVDELRRA